MTEIIGSCLSMLISFNIMICIVSLKVFIHAIYKELRGLSSKKLQNRNNKQMTNVGIKSLQQT
jgi:hypothetical protein